MLLWTQVYKISAQVPAFNFFVGSYGNSIFNFFRNHHTVFYCSCTILHSQKQCTRIPISPHPHQHLLFSIFLITVILMGTKWYLMILICISLMLNGIEYLIMGSVVICISSLEKCLFKSFAHFSIRLFGFCCWILGVFYMFWILIPYQIDDFQIFSPILWIAILLCWQHALIHQSFSFWWSPICLFFSFVACVLLL